MHTTLVSVNTLADVTVDGVPYPLRYVTTVYVPRGAHTPKPENILLAVRDRAMRYPLADAKRIAKHLKQYGFDYLPTDILTSPDVLVNVVYDASTLAYHLNPISDLPLYRFQRRHTTSRKAYQLSLQP